MWARFTVAVKGWKTIIWSVFLMLLGAGLTALTALDGDMVAAVLPDKYKVFAPMIYSFAVAIIGGVTAYLRSITDTSVGQKE